MSWWQYILFGVWALATLVCLWHWLTRIESAIDDVAALRDHLDKQQRNQKMEEAKEAVDEWWEDQGL